MSLYEKDSIVALATPRGIAALSVVRVSGDSLSSLFSKLTNIKKIVPRYAYYRKLVDLSDSPIDDVVIIFYQGPSSFTGEDLIEVSCHGGDVVAKKIIHDLIKRGCRYAEPGEFSKRAFLNGKITLAQAEGTNSIIHAKSSLEAEKGFMGLEGKAHAYLTKAKDSLTSLLTIIEHELDFVEDEIDTLSDAVVKKELEDSILLIQKVLQGSLIGNKIQGGFRVSLVGPPNAGKSSLFNSLLGYDRAIISPEKGTTRDTIEAFVEIGGYPVVLIDTAGHWSGKDKLDALGIKKTEKTIQESDIILAIDEKNPKSFIKPFKIKNKPVICIISKSDLGNKIKKDSFDLKTSSLKDSNVDLLLTHLSTEIRSSFFKEDVFLCSERQLLLLKKSCESLVSLLNNKFTSTDMVEKASVIRVAAEGLREVFGEIYNEDILNNIFKGFCVGK